MFRDVFAFSFPALLKKCAELEAQACAAGFAREGFAPYGTEMVDAFSTHTVWLDDSCIMKKCMMMKAALTRWISCTTHSCRRIKFDVPPQNRYGKYRRNFRMSSPL